MKRLDGFTRIEFRIVVAIITILAALAVSALLRSRWQTHETLALTTTLPNRLFELTAYPTVMSEGS